MPRYQEQDPTLIPFLANVTYTLALKYNDGKEVQTPRSLNGGPKRFMFSTTDGRKAFVDEPVARTIWEMGIQKGEPISITKYKKPGKGQPEMWDVRRIDPSANPHPSVEATLPEDSSYYERQFARSVDAAQNAGRTVTIPPEPARKPIPREVERRFEAQQKRTGGEFIPPDAAERLSQPYQAKTAAAAPQSNGNGHLPRLEDQYHAYMASEATTPAIQRRPVQSETRLVERTRELIDAFATCQKYANEKWGGLVNNETVRSLLLSEFINDSKAGGGR
jgi:hypothetical protein